MAWRREDGQPFSPRILQARSRGGLIFISLSIQNAEVSDFGAYVCFANNSVGNTSSIVNIIEDDRTPPKVKIVSDQKQIVIYEGKKYPFVKSHKIF